MGKFEKEILSSLKKVFPEIKSLPELEIPPDPKMGDLGFGCFSLSKELQKPPEKIAETLALKIKPSAFIEKVKNYGPYLNFFFKKQVCLPLILKTIFLEKDLFLKEYKNRNILIEFSSPNTNKPLHLGHLRNTVLGNAISNLFAKVGARVIRINLINDRGIPIIKAMIGWEKWGKGKTPETEKVKSDHFVGYYYVLFETKAKELPEIKKYPQELLKKWEKKHPGTLLLWQKINNWALKGFSQTYKKLGVSFDKIEFESEVYESGKKIIKRALRKKIVQKRTDGAIEIDLENLGKKVLLRPDGTSVYITQDIGLAYKRVKEFQLDKLIYVVASEQDYYFQCLFKTLKKLGLKNVKNFYHLSYGLVNLPEGKMKSREGKVVDADDLIQQMEDMAQKEVQSRWPDTPIEKINQRAEKIALAAIKFYLLYFTPPRNILFDPKKSLSIEELGGPYLLYTYARANSILEKSKYNLQIKDIGNIDFSKLDTEKDLNIFRNLFFWPEIIKKSVKEYNPAHLANFLIKIAQSFNEFYHSEKVINSSLEKQRVFLVKAVAKVIKDGLNLLGIDVIKKM
ncbi:arginine--tRNA ligase [bacterium]|nr:arginine--tRNA ligase [bacterium]